MVRIWKLQKKTINRTSYLIDNILYCQFIDIGSIEKSSNIIESIILNNVDTSILPVYFNTIGCVCYYYS